MENSQQATTIPYPSYKDYSGTRLSCSPPETKPIPGTGPTPGNPNARPTNYYQIQLLYNYSVNESNKILQDFMLEGCEMETSTGIQSRPAQSQQTATGQANNAPPRMEHSIMCKFDPGNADHNKFIETMSLVHGGCAFILSQYKGMVKMLDYNAQTPENGLKHPIYRARDETTGELLQGRAPSMFFKLFTRGKPPMVEQTLFTDLNMKPIPWSLLEGVEMKFIPLIHVKRIYIGGGKASLQMEVVSAIVTSLRARNTATRQSSTIERLKLERPELTDIISGQIAKLTADRQEKLLAPIHENGAVNEDKATFHGIMPERINPNITPPLSTQPSLQDMIASAPLRTASTTVPSVPPIGQVATLQLN